MSTWPDGLPVHDLTLYVRLSCGHERASRGWRGQEGDTYCCDACHQLTTMEVVALTDDVPYEWRTTGTETIRQERDRYYQALVEIATYQHGDSQRQQDLARAAIRRLDGQDGDG